MRTVKLGPLDVSCIGFGCMGLTSAYGERPDRSEMVRLLRSCVDMGVTFFDTAEVYGPLINEELVGEGLGPVRDQVVIATKFGFDVSAGTLPARGMNSKPAHIKQVCDASLKRLGIETIDLLYQHRVDPEVPIEDVAGAVGDLIKAGKVRAFGLSEPGANTIRRAHAVTPVAAVQNEYSLWTRDPEKEILGVLRELGIGMVPYSPLGRGLLAGAVKDEASLSASDFRRTLPRFRGEALKKNLSLVETLKTIADAKGVTSAQLALAWLLHQGDDIAPIPGTTRRSRVEQNIGAADIALSADELSQIEAAIPETAVEGERYEAAQMARLGV